MTAVTWVLLAGFVAVAAGDWLAVRRGSTRLEYVCKPGCMVVLLVAAVLLEPADGGARVALVAALALSTAGDVFLMLPDLFVPGLGSFLLAHVAYVVGFVLAGVHGPALAVGVLAGAAVVVTLGRRVVAAARAGAEPELAAPVAAYVGVISTMVATAVGTADPRAVLGAGLFAGSDSLIAWERFVRHRPWGPLAIIVSYHAAQALLLLSFAR